MIKKPWWAPIGKGCLKELIFLTEACFCLYFYQILQFAQGFGVKLFELGYLDDFKIFDTYFCKNLKQISLNLSSQISHHWRRKRTQLENEGKPAKILRAAAKVFPAPTPFLFLTLSAVTVTFAIQSFVVVGDIVWWSDMQRMVISTRQNFSIHIFETVNFFCWSLWRFFVAWSKFAFRDGFLLFFVLRVEGRRGGGGLSTRGRHWYI